MRARKKVLVLSQFQRWFLINFVLYTAGFLLILSGGLFLWFNVIVKEILNLGGLLSPTFLEMVNKHVYFGIGVIVLLVACLIGLAAFQSIYFSHRIAGPIFALLRHLEKCEADGKLSHFKLRDKDLFIDVANQFNRMSDKVSKGR